MLVDRPFQYDFECQQNTYLQEGDIQNFTNYREIKLISHTMKL